MRHFAAFFASHRPHQLGRHHVTGISSAWTMQVLIKRVLSASYLTALTQAFAKLR
jgi:hypothetical protein